MRLCRFRCDDLVLTGFFADNVVIPLDQAAEAYSRDTGVELLLPSTEDLLALLPPDGSSFAMARDLDAWVTDLDVFARDELTVAVADVQILVPITRCLFCNWPPTSNWSGLSGQEGVLYRHAV